MKTVLINCSKAIKILKEENLKIPDRGESILLKTGAKMYHRQNGRWCISGYAQDDSDVNSYMQLC